MKIKIVPFISAGLLLFSCAACAGIVNNRAQESARKAASGSAEIISITHFGLKTLAEAAGLTPGQKYRITDFRTRHTILYTSEINTGPNEVLIVTALTASKLEATAYSESYPQDVIVYELENTLHDPAVDRGTITYRWDTRKDISSYEDWRVVKFRRGRDLSTGKFTEITDFSKGYVDRHPFNNSSDPFVFNRVHIGKPTGPMFSNIVIGSGASMQTMNVLIGQSSNSITIGDNSSSIEIAQVNGSITIGDDCTHIRIGVCSDFIAIGDRCGLINVGSNSSMIAIKDSVNNCNIGDNVLGVTVGDGARLANIYIGHGVNYDPTPVIRASGTIERYLSTIPATIDITGLTSIDLANYMYAGIINLTSKNATESLKTILKKTDPNGTDFPLELRPAASLNLTVAGTPFESLSADGQIMMKGNLVLNGARGDSITLKRKSVGKYSVFVEVSRSVY